MEMQSRWVVCAALAMGAAGMLSGEVAKAATCAEVAKYDLPGITIESAEPVPAGNMPMAPGMPPSNLELPAYCRVRGRMHDRTGADQQHYAINFELALPEKWNQKFLFQGGGGLDGMVMPAIGMVGGAAAPALSRGYAVVSMDGGHQGMANSQFGKEQQARLDYAYAAIGDVTRAAKEILARFYGGPAQHSYFAGCSNGGREALVAAQRYPLEFDGVIAGDPGFDLSHAAIGEAWDTETFAAIAPKDASGHPILSEAFSPGDLDLVSRAVLAKCDALDGVKDGEINNIRACRFDPDVLVCKGGKGADCLTRQQVDALKRSFGGAHTSTGQRLYSGWPYDAGISGMDWRGWKLGTSPTAQANAVNATMGSAALREYFVHPFLPDFDPRHVDFDAIAQEVEETHVINDPVSTDYGTFAARGGRAIIYEGGSDPVFSADDLMAYYDRFVKDNGGLEKAQSIERLFLVPGMNHCGRGPSTDQFDALTSLERWTEHGEAPDRIVASGQAFPNRTRPLCPYPLYAAYKGSGNTEDAANFVCR
jgi:acetyl esterase/lipase